MANYLITGVSSGLGRELTKTLVKQNHHVFGLARRKDLLQSLKTELGKPDHYDFIDIDIAEENAWKKIVAAVAKINFTPNVVIFNAAIFEKDYLGKELNYNQTKNIFEINLFSVIRGFEELIKIAKPGTQFVFISSSSALKGSGAEGIGYPSSKAALSIAFESLYQKYRGRYRLKLIYFGPIHTDMLPFKSRFTPVLSKEQAVQKIIRTVSSGRAIVYYPGILFLFLRIIKLLPDFIYLTILNQIDILHIKSSKE